MRGTFINTLTEAARENESIYLVIGDTGFSVFEPFEKEFAGRFINVGIAEQNFVSFSAGLAAMGLKVFAYNVVSFMVERAMEQIILDICYQENPVVLVGVGGGFAYGTAGPTHHAVVDIALLRAIPGLTIVCPADPVEMKAAVLAAVDFPAPLYLRLGRSVDEVVHKQPIDFKIGKAILMERGTDVAVFSYGTMQKEAVQACALLRAQGISPSLYSMHTIKPLDKQAICDAAKTHKAIVSMEEHSIIGGLGTAIAEVLAEQSGKIPFQALGVADAFAPVTGSRDYLLDLNGISPVKAAKTIATLLEGLT